MVTGEITSSSGSVTLVSGSYYVTSSDCCAQRFPTYTEAVEANKKKKPKNNPIPPWARKRIDGRRVRM